MSCLCPAQAPSPVAEKAATDHPLSIDEAVTNEHTALMTLARAAALEYYEAGKYKLAEAKFIEALLEAKLGFDPKDPHIASSQNNLAEFYRNTKQYDKAEGLYKEALSQLDLIYGGEKHWLYVSTLHNLALMYEAAGRVTLGCLPACLLPYRAIQAPLHEGQGDRVPSGHPKQETLGPWTDSVVLCQGGSMRQCRRCKGCSS